MMWGGVILFLQVLIQVIITVKPNLYGHIMPDDTYVEAQKICKRHSGVLASYEEFNNITKISENCYVQNIWLDDIRVTTPYLHEFNGLENLTQYDSYGEKIPRCFMHCDSRKPFKVLYVRDRDCICDVNLTGKQVQDRTFTVWNDTADAEESFMILGCAAILGIPKPFNKFVPLKQLGQNGTNLNTICVGSNNKTNLLDSIKSNWTEANKACLSKGDRLPISLTRSECRALSHSLNDSLLWSGIKNYHGHFLYRDFMNISDISDKMRYVQCGRANLTEKDNWKTVQYGFYRSNPLLQLKYLCITDKNVDEKECTIPLHSNISTTTVHSEKPNINTTAIPKGGNQSLNFALGITGTIGSIAIVIRVVVVVVKKKSGERSGISERTSQNMDDVSDFIDLSASRKTKNLNKENENENNSPEPVTRYDDTDRYRESNTPDQGDHWDVLSGLDDRLCSD